MMSAMCDDPEKFLNSFRTRKRGIVSGLNSINEPRCFAPHVDVTRARLAYGKLALPTLVRDLEMSKGQNEIRQIISSIADILMNPEEISVALELKIHERLAELLISEDPYLREKVAIIYSAMCRRAVGSEAILRRHKILHNLSIGLDDPLDVIRAKMAQVFETLARNPLAAEELCLFGFMEKLVDRIGEEKEDAILVVHLECLESLTLLNEKVKIRVLETGVMEKLLSLFQNHEEKVVSGSLSCIAILCEVILGKEKLYDLNILPILKTFLEDERDGIRGKAVSLIVFATITSRGRRQAFELDIVENLVQCAVNSIRDRELQLASIKALSNIAELPEGRSMLLSNYCMLLEDIDTGGDESTEEHRKILLEIIRWRS